MTDRAVTPEVLPKETNEDIFKRIADENVHSVFSSLLGPYAPISQDLSDVERNTKLLQDVLDGHREHRRHSHASNLAIALTTLNSALGRTLTEDEVRRLIPS